jgi:prepilin-type N-terminal cleavage/methylation domain-containing protein
MVTNPRSAFTLIELLVVIAIIAILAVVVVLTLNPAQLLAQSRDANRVSDMATLTSAINLYNTDQSGASSYSLGSGSSTYISIPDATSTSCVDLTLFSLGASSTWACAPPATYHQASSTGWIPINFSSISSGAPLSALPVDPVNTTSSGFYYSYLPSPTTQGSYELVARLESQKYASISGAGGEDGGISTQYIESGKDLTIAPTYAPKILDRVSSTDYLAFDTQGLVGYWPLNEGANNIAYDQSGNGDNGTWGGTQGGTSGYYSAGYVGSWAGTAAQNKNDIVSVPYSSALALTSNFTMSFWINFTTAISTGGGSQYFGTAGHSGYTLYLNCGAGPCTNVSPEYATNYPTCDGSAYTVPLSGPSFGTGVWHLVVLTYDGTTVRYYSDGALYASAAGPSGGQMCPETVSQPFYMDQSSVTGAYLMDDARIYSRVISAQEVQEMYKGGL